MYGPDSRVPKDMRLKLWESAKPVLIRKSTASLDATLERKKSEIRSLNFHARKIEKEK
jgi:hypothetical protein